MITAYEHRSTVRSVIAAPDGMPSSCTSRTASSARSPCCSTGGAGLRCSRSWNGERPDSRRPMPERTAEQRFAALARSLTREEGVTLGSGKRGFGSDALHVNGRIFAMLRDGCLVLKLPTDHVAALVRSGKGAAFDAGKDTPMKQWVVPDFGAKRDWPSLAREALLFLSQSSPVSTGPTGVSVTKS